MTELKNDVMRNREKRHGIVPEDFDIVAAALSFTLDNRTKSQEEAELIN